MNSFRGDLTDVSAETKALIPSRLSNAAIMCSIESVSLSATVLDKELLVTLSFTGGPS